MLNIISHDENNAHYLTFSMLVKASIDAKKLNLVIDDG